MCGHGKLDLNFFFHSNAEMGVETTRLDRKVYTSRAKIAEENIVNHEFWRNRFV